MRQFRASKIQPISARRDYRNVSASERTNTNNSTVRAGDQMLTQEPVVSEPAIHAIKKSKLNPLRKLVSKYRSLRGLKFLPKKLVEYLHRIKSIRFKNWKKIESGALAFLLIFSIVVPFLPTEFAKAATATIVADADVTRGWPTVVGCTATTHFDCVNESTPVTTDYVATGTGGSTGEIEEYTLGNVANVASATSVAVVVHAQSATNANGGNLDTLNINLRINGTLQTSVVCMPEFNIWANCNATFSGTYTQADIDALQVQVTRTRQGGGSPANQDDDVRIASVYATVTYTPGVNFEQSAYRWFENQDTTISDGTTWLQKTASANWSGRYEHTSVVYDNKMWVIGGTTGTGNEDDVWYSTDGATWAQATAAAAFGGRQGHTSVVFDNKMWVIGGYSVNATANEDDVWYSTDGATWTQATAAAGWAARQSHTSVVFDNKIWVIGGTANGVWYSTNGTNWTQATASPAFGAVDDHTSVVYDNKMWVIAGNNGSASNDVWQSSDGITWTAATTAAAFGARQEHVSVVYDNKMWVMVGSNGSTAEWSVWSSTDGTNWSQAVSNPGWSGRQGSSAVIYDNRMWVLGGYLLGSYRQDVWYSSNPAVNVGASLVALSTPATAASEGTPFRLRMNLHASIGNAETGTALFKLQFSQRGADNVCDTSFTNETYQDVSPSSGVIRYSNNTNAVDGQTLAVNANDPTHSGHTVTPQTYEESNNFGISTTIPNGTDGMWDFALVDHSAPASTAYCFRAVYSTGGLLSTYSVIPQITTQSASLEQSGYRWYENQDGQQSNTIASTLGGSQVEWSNEVVLTGDGGYVVVGKQQSYSAGGDDINISKMNTKGEEIWTKSWGGTGEDNAYSVVATADGGFVVAGYTNSPGLTSGSYDVVLIKLDSSGVEQWSKTWGGSGDDRAIDLVLASDGGLVIGGYTNSYGAGDYDKLLVKFNSSGVEQWSKTWGTAAEDYGWSIIVTSDGGIAMTGFTYSFGFVSSTATLVKFNSSGVEQWSKTWGNGSSDGIGLAEDAQGNIIMVGNGTGAYGDGLYSNQIIAKFNSSGIEQWSKTWGGSFTDATDGVVVLPDGGYLTYGETVSYGAGNSDAVLTKYNNDGTYAWTKLYGTVQADNAYGLAMLPDGGAVIAGYNQANGGDSLFLKYDSSFNIANCGPPTCQSISVSPTDISITEVDRTITEGDHAVAEVDRVTSETDRTASSVQTYLNGHLTFAKSIGGGGTGLDQGYAVIQTIDGGYAVAGQYAASSIDMALIKFSPNGTEEWTTTWGGVSGDYAYDVVQLSDGSFVMTGQAITNQIALVKISSTGTKIWSKTWGANTSIGNALIATSDGGFVVVGGSNNFNTSRDAVIIKFNSNGIEQWAKTWAGSAYDDAFDVIELSDGSLVMVGQTGSYGVTTGGTDDDIFIVKFNSMGIEQWSKTWGGTGREKGVGLIEQSDGSFIVAGYTNSMGAGNFDQVMVKFNSMGIEQWSKTWGGTNNDYSYGIAKTPDGGFVTAGELSASASTIVKYTADGVKEWSNYWNGSGVEFANAIATTQDGGYIVTGATNTTSFTTGSYDITLLKYDSRGLIENCNTTTMCLVTATQPVDQSITEGDVNISETDRAVTEVDDTTAVASQTASTTETLVVAVAPWLESLVLPGVALAINNTVLENVQRNTVYRLRVLQHVNAKGAAANAFALKLQVAPKVGTCDTSFIGEIYSDVTTGSAVKYYTGNTTPDGGIINAHPNDPSHSGHINVLQSYETANTFSNINAISIGQDGLWDYALFVDDVILGGSFCIRVVDNTGVPLAGYSQIPEINIPAKPQQQLRHGRFFSAGGEIQPFKWR